MSSRTLRAPFRVPTALLMFAALFIVAASCDDSTGPVSDAEAQILFLSTRDGATDALGRPMKEIYRVSADGSGLRNLTQQPAWQYVHLSLSPDGSRILFASDRSGCDIWVMNVNGTGVTKLTNTDGGQDDRCNALPRWSPDGRLIAYTTNRENRTIGAIGGLYDVYVMNADGTNPHKVSHGVQAALGTDVGVIGWSPDGQVVFQSRQIAGAISRRVFVVNSDGTEPAPLFEHPEDHSPAWSPDGSRMAFISQRDGPRRLYIMNADGSNARPLTSHGGDDWLAGLDAGTSTLFDYDPWSPDGTRIAFVVDREFGWGVHVIDADGSNLRRLTNRPAFFNGWSPDGRSIAYTEYVNRPGGSANDVLLLDVATGDIVNLTDSPFDDSDALWLR